MGPLTVKGRSGDLQMEMAKIGGLKHRRLGLLPVAEGPRG